MANRTCSAPGCERPHRARGWCSTHYDRWRKVGHASPNVPVQKRDGSREECAAPDCERAARARGYCDRHYQNLTKYGRVIPLRDLPLIDRIRHVGWDVTPAGCWEWRGARNGDGYGLHSHRRVHRIIYEAEHGPIPAGMIVRHSCDNPPCVNPDHLLVGTHQDNAQDKIERGRHQAQSRSECRQGHDLTLPGAIRPGTVSECQECARARRKRWAMQQRSSQLIEG